jgi:hypothetical protein
MNISKQDLCYFKNNIDELEKEICIINAVNLLTIEIIKNIAKYNEKKITIVLSSKKKEYDFKYEILNRLETIFNDLIFIGNYCTNNFENYEINIVGYKKYTV